MTASVKTSRQQIQNVLAQIREAIHEEGGPLTDSLSDRSHPLFPENNNSGNLNGYRSSASSSSNSSLNTGNSSSVGSSTRASGASTIDRPWLNGTTTNGSSRYDDSNSSTSSLGSRSITSSAPKIGNSTASSIVKDTPSSIRDSRDSDDLSDRRRDLSLFPNDSVIGSNRRDVSMYSSDGAAALRRTRDSSLSSTSNTRDDHLDRPPVRGLSDPDVLGRRDDYSSGSGTNNNSSLSSDIHRLENRPTSSMKSVDTDRDNFGRDRRPLDTSPLSAGSSSTNRLPVSSFDRFGPPSPPGRSRAGINGSIDPPDNNSNNSNNNNSGGYRNNVISEDPRRLYGGSNNRDIPSDLGSSRDYLARRPLLPSSSDRSGGLYDRDPSGLISRMNIDSAGRSIDSAQPRALVNDRDLREQHIRSIVRSQEREREWRRGRDDEISPYEQRRPQEWGRREHTPSSRWNDEDQGGWSDVAPFDHHHHPSNRWDDPGTFRRPNIGRVEDERGRWNDDSPYGHHHNGRDDDEVVHTDVVGSPRRHREQVAFIDVTPEGDGFYYDDEDDGEDDEGFVAASDEDLYAASIAFHSGFLKAASVPAIDGRPPYMPPQNMPPRGAPYGGPPYPNQRGNMRGAPPPAARRAGRGGRDPDMGMDDMGRDRPGIATGMGQAMPAWFNQGMAATGDRGVVPLLAGKPHPMAAFMFNGQLTLQSFPPLDATPVPIVEHIFLGDFHCSANRENLLRLGIRAIVNCTSEIACHFPDSFHYLRVNVDDLASMDIKQYFQQAINFMDTAKRHGDNVLVHCLAGRARSASIVICYLMARLGMNLRTAFEFVRQRKPDIRPNVGFWGQLIAFDIELFGRASMQLEQGQAIPA